MDDLGIWGVRGDQGGSIAVRFSPSTRMVKVLQVGLYVAYSSCLVSWGPPLTSGSMGFASDDSGNV